MSVAALVLAAGRGERLGATVPKAFAGLAGRPLLVHALEALAASQSLDRLLPVVARADLGRFSALSDSLDAIDGVMAPVIGGDQRQDSVRAGLAALPADVEWVAVHDAARPLVRPGDVDRVVAAARQYGAAILGLPVRDTIKRVRDGRIRETPPRAECYAAQTPQVFRVELLREALEKAAAERFQGTDDAELVERLGVAVALVDGDASNLKVTDSNDLKTAERFVAERAAAAR
ncbi:MAG: 2-C-methyl-D-erythritol 4-phosphate cytidylyltransferase [Myxococcota bacterium]